MAADEEWERWKLRQDALTESVELLLHETRELRESIIELRETATELRQTANRQGETVDQLVRAVTLDAENIRALARIAEAHERRISRLEDQAPE